MKIYINSILVLLLVSLVFVACKKGSISGEDGPSPNTYSTMASNSFVSHGNGIAPTFVNTNTTVPVDDGEDDPTPTPTVQTSSDRLIYSGTTFSNLVVSSASTSAYYAISASASTSSLVCTLYFKSKPTSSTSYNIEDVGGSSPSTGSAWLVATISNSTNIATSGVIAVSVANSKVTAIFNNVTVSGSSSAVVSGTLAGK
jgi:hypothetical protein